MAEEKKTIYFICVHPAACWFWDNVFNFPKRIFMAMGLAFLLTLLSQIYPICTENFCFTIFAQMFFSPSLLFKPFTFNLIIVPAFFIFMILTIAWLTVLTVFSAIQKTGKVHELFFIVLGALFFVYMAFLVSGTLGQFFMNTGLVECVSNSDCIRAGYVGEVCASVYRPVYSQYAPDLEPLEKCSCIANKCVGS